MPYQGSVYKTLLPQNRETLTAGSPQDRVVAGKDFATRLKDQTSKPVLMSLGTTVETFYAQGQLLRNAQLARINEVTVLRAAQEVLRKEAAAALYLMVGYGMIVWKDMPLMLDTLFDVNLMRATPQVVPGAFGSNEVVIPAAVTWDSGDLYQLWLVARNAKGASGPGPSTSWTAP